MPITQWICTGCGGREVALDHFALTPCGEKVVHPDYAAAVLASANKDRPGVHVSTILGCPRKAAIEATEPYSVDPMTMNAMETGTAWHAHMEKSSVSPKDCEVQLDGFVAGIRITGKTDRLEPPTTVCDWKHGGDFSKKYAKEGPKETHQAQLSLYAELCSQTLGWRPTIGRIWHHFSGQDKDAMFPSEFPIWALEKVLAFRPGGGTYTVLQLLQQANGYFSGHLSWETLPLAGETHMYGQKTACNYCGVFGICKTQATGAPF